MMRLVWAVLCIGGVAAAGVALYRWLDVPVRSDSISVIRSTHDPNSVILRWDGPVDPPMGRIFTLEFNKIKNTADKIIINLNSPGGDVREGDVVIRAIRNMKRTHKVLTYVGPDDKCMSMCVPIYLEGHERIAAASSTWMFHRPYAVNPVTGEPTVQFGNEKNMSAQNFYYRFFVESPMSPEWREGLRQQWKNRDIYKTGRSLMRERSNIITKIGIVEGVVFDALNEDTENSLK